MSSPRTSSHFPKSEGALRSSSAVVMLEVGVDMVHSLHAECGGKSPALNGESHSILRIRWWGNKIHHQRDAST